MRGGGSPPMQVVTSQVGVSSNSNSGVITRAPRTSEWGGLNSLTTKLIVTSVTGSVTVAIEHSDDGSTGWTAIDTYPLQNSTTTGIVRQIASTSVTKAFLRVSWTIVTGPVTFSVTFAANPGQMV